MIWSPPSAASAPLTGCGDVGFDSAPAYAPTHAVPPPPRGANRANRPDSGIVPNAVLLQGVPLLRGLPAPLLQHIASRSRIEVYLRGQSIVEQDAPADAWLVVLSGRANLSRLGGNGRAVLLETLEAGSHFGEAALIDAQPYGARLRCTTQCRVMVLPGDEFLRCLAQSPELVQGLTQVLVRRLREANQRIASLALQDVRDRVVTWLRSTALPGADGWLLPKTPSRTALANSIGASREMVSRIIKSLMLEGRLEERPDGKLLLHAEGVDA